MKPLIRLFASASAGVLFVSLLLLFACTEKTYITNVTNPTPDTRPPTVEWVSVAQYPPSIEGGQGGLSSTLRDTVTLTVSASDESGIDSVKLYINGFERFSRVGRAAEPDDSVGFSDPTYAFLWNTLSDSDGIYSLEARAWDKAGNVGVSPVLTLQVSNTTPPPPPDEDRTPPDVWWEYPVAGSVLSDTSELIVRLFDESDVDSVKVYVDGFPRFSRVGRAAEPDDSVGFSDPTYAFLWNTLSDSDGVHLLEARGWDASGNEGRSSGLLVRVQNNPEPPSIDFRPPVIVWRSPTPGDTVQGRVELCFDVMDDVGVDSARVYINGVSNQNLLILTPEIQQNVIWITYDYEDSNYIITISAWDRSGNVGASMGVVFRVWNNKPRVIWVPDDYERIQDAIWASIDGDTVRVRAGTYREGVRFMGKNIWLESEEGPEQTLIDATGWAHGVFVTDTELNVTIRGFSLISNYIGISTENAQVNVYNCLISNPQGAAGIWFERGGGNVRNCVVIDGEWGIRMFYAYGTVFNCIMASCDIGYMQQNGYGNWVDYAWNLYWQNGVDFYGSEAQQGDVFADPRFENGSYCLQQISPAIDAGNPEILDLNGSRSDIGLYGGPYAYPPPQE